MLRGASVIVSAMPVVPRRVTVPFPSLNEYLRLMGWEARITRRRVVRPRAGEQEVREGHAWRNDVREVGHGGELPAGPFSELVDHRVVVDQEEITTLDPAGGSVVGIDLQEVHRPALDRCRAPDEVEHVVPDGVDPTVEHPQLALVRVRAEDRVPSRHRIPVGECEVGLAAHRLELHVGVKTWGLADLAPLEPEGVSERPWFRGSGGARGPTLRPPAPSPRAPGSRDAHRRTSRRPLRISRSSRPTRSPRIPSCGRPRRRSASRAEPHRCGSMNLS